MKHLKLIGNKFSEEVRKLLFGLRIQQSPLKYSALFVVRQSVASGLDDVLSNG